jgi:enterochelin esterase-like enzyme
VVLAAGAAVCADEARTVRITVEAPAAAQAVYITGNRPELGPWNPGKMAMRREGDRHLTTLVVPHGTPLEFKFTLGSWASEALNEDGSVPANHVVLVDGDKDLVYKVARFRDGPATGRGALPAAEGAGVLGTLIYHHNVPSKHLRHPRHVAVWLPPNYEARPHHRYPVLYMHDGQNLFDPRLAFTGIDWGADEAVVRLVEAGKMPPIIIVGVFNSPDRTTEYNPLTGGPSYARFLIEELKPMIDATYRTRPEAKYTGVMGSSAGGLISLGLGFKHPQVFTRIGALSAHLPPIPPQLGGTGRSFVDEIEASPMPRGLRIYFDRSESGIDATYGPHHQRLAKLLTDRGWRKGEDLMVGHFPGTGHTEADWRKRLDIPLEFLFGDLAGEAEGFPERGQ